MSITLAADREFAALYLADGTVKVRGFDVEARWPRASFSSLYASAFGEPLYDIILLPVTNLLVAIDRGRPLIGLPVFPDVFFPHIGAQVNHRSGIRTPKDLEGKRVGTSGYGFNPAVWLRGALTDVYDVDSSKVVWVESEPNSLSTADYPRPSRFAIEKGGDPAKELASGQLDAFFYARAGPPLNMHMARLFDDPLAEALRYYDQTSVFPVNTVLAAKAESLAANPGLAEAVVAACDEARNLYYQNVKPDDSHMGFPIWWLRDHGLFPHRNGLEANRRAMETVIRYSLDAGIIERKLALDDVFFPTYQA